MRSPIDLLLYEGSRKPEVAILIENIENMTDADIENSKVPLPWYKSALKLLRKKNIGDKNHKIAEAWVLKGVVDGKVPDTSGTIREWDGSKVILLDRGGLEIKTGTLLWFPLSGGIWIDTIFSQRIDPCLMSSIFLRQSTKSEYSEACRQKRNRNSDNIPFTVVEGAGAGNQSYQGFTISKL